MAAPAIETQELAKTYAHGLEALADLELRVEAAKSLVTSARRAGYN